MKSTIIDSFRHLWSIEKHERTKLFLVSIIFALVIMSYTICKEMKDIVFAEVIGGKDYQNIAKIVSIFALIPAILFYSYLVNRIRRHQLLIFYTVLYGILGLVFTYLIGHPIIGIQNTDTGPGRIFGWVFYIFIEGYSPFIVSVAWAFANSIFSPREAKNYYAFLVAFSKIGGILSAGLGWFMLSKHIVAPLVIKEQLLLLIPSLIILTVPFFVLLLRKKVSGKNLHGYEAVYEYQKETEKKQEQPGIISGLISLVKTPYVFGIFSIIFFYEVIGAVLSYLRIIYAWGDPEQFGSNLFVLVFSYHAVGFCISLFGTQALLRLIGERRCLLLVPLVMGFFLTGFLVINTYWAFVIAFVVIKALNYGFFYPVRESLYIPTTKEIKFQSKAWIDAFGTKTAKASGSLFNEAAKYSLTHFGTVIFQSINALFFGAIIGGWVLIAQALGKRYSKAIKNNEVIGATDQ